MRDIGNLRAPSRVGKRRREGALEFAASRLVRFLDRLRRVGDAGVRFIERRDLLREALVQQGMPERAEREWADVPLAAP
jgi:hypothetical protein